ncbi:hypothetical protein FNV43_RR12903 [Rhamnella rubrinervis]|uniref:Uncharacterized protein n=1 Tax=Rhamnella rubrinervis TaxID=2594499 RepID=A0A8K0H017_9ROSA|nr:hypothetical protein FNV43_RR12903 [Rhamnella rubrinervis]
MAKLIGRDFSSVLTTMRGTRGRRNSEYYVECELSFFPVYAANVMIEGHDVFSLLDERLEGEADEEDLIRLYIIACWCIQGNEAHRPSMGLIVQILEGIINVNVPPFPRLLQVLDDNPDDIGSLSESSQE